MLISLNRMKITVRKRWYLKITFHCIDIAKTNGWVLYRCNCDLLRTPKKDKTIPKILPLALQKIRIWLDLLAIHVNKVCLQAHQLVKSQISQHQSMMFSLMALPIGQNGAKAEVGVNDTAWHALVVALNAM